MASQKSITVFLKKNTEEVVYSKDIAYRMVNQLRTQNCSERNIVLLKEAYVCNTDYAMGFVTI